MTAIQPQLQNFDFEKDSNLSSPREFTKLPLADIVLPQKQPRRYFDPQKLSELTESIRQHGVLEPLLVRRSPSLNNQYELVAGERRYRAAKSAGLTEVPVAICHFSDSEALTVSLIENLQREDLNPLEETEGILTLLSLRLEMEQSEVIRLFYRMRHEANDQIGQNVLTSSGGQTIQTVFDSLGLLSWESFVTSRLPLLKLPEDLLEVLRSGKIAYTKAKAIAAVKDGQLRQALIEEAVSQNLSLSQIRERIKEIKFSTSSPSHREPTIEARLQQIARSLMWKNPKKKPQVEQLLAQLEVLMSE